MIHVVSEGFCPSCMVRSNFLELFGQINSSKGSVEMSSKGTSVDRAVGGRVIVGRRLLLVVGANVGFVVSPVTVSLTPRKLDGSSPLFVLPLMLVPLNMTPRSAATAHSNIAISAHIPQDLYLRRLSLVSSLFASSSSPAAAIGPVDAITGRGATAVTAPFSSSFSCTIRSFSSRTTCVSLSSVSFFLSASRMSTRKRVCSCCILSVCVCNSCSWAKCCCC
mmetsp:Transcript_14810/g.26896  ORF Transcript_14810/g.26896 Transcript_14810/m.26896 type:complete len:221 (-) Transcript_14810:580-1242(-)